MMQEDYQKYLAEVEQKGNLKTTGLCYLAFKKRYRSIEYMPHSEQTAEMAFVAVKHCPRYLRFIAPQLRTPELCLLAVQANANALLYVPDELQTLDLCRLAICKNHKTLKYVSIKLRTEELCKFALSQLLAQAHVFDFGDLRPFKPTIKYVPLKQRNLELFKFMLYSFKQRYGVILDFQRGLYDLQNHFAVRWWDDISILIRVIKNQDFLKGVPKDEQTEQVFINELTEANKNYYSKRIDEKIQTIEWYLLIISKSSDYFRSIPREIINADFCKLALSENTDVAEFIPNTLWTDDFVLSVIYDNRENFKLVIRMLGCHTPKDFFDNKANYEIAKKAWMFILKENGWHYRYLPEIMQCEELALIALESCTSDYWKLEIFKCKSDAVKTQKFCWFMLQRQYKVDKNATLVMTELWNLTPDIHKDDVMCRYIIEHGVSLKYVPESLKTDELCLLALQKDEKTAIFYVSEKFQMIDKILLHSKNNNSEAVKDFINHLPKKYQNDDFFLQLLRVNCSLFIWLPIQLKTEIVCCYAVQIDIQNIQFVPDEMKTMESIMLTLIKEKINRFAIYPYEVKYIPLILITSEFCEAVVQKDPMALQYIPDSFKTPKMCWEAVKKDSRALEFVP